MLDDDQLTFDGRERAYRVYRERGELGSAARVAAWHAFDCLAFRGEPAVANGWLQRARSLLDDLEPGPAHGWLAFHEGHIALSLEEDTATARRLAARAVELGREFGVPELEMLGLGLEGRALVSEGELGPGMRRLDEATAAALGGEAKLLVCVAWACCYLIAACERIRDVDRAGQWCTRVGEFCERHGIGLMLGFAGRTSAPSSPGRASGRRQSGSFARPPTIWRARAPRQPWTRSSAWPSFAGARDGWMRPRSCSPDARAMS